jgi:hypothetical protein
VQTKTRRVNSVEDLVEAAGDNEARDIVLTTDLSEAPPIALLPGQELRSDSGGPRTLTFREHSDGLRLSSNNRIEGVNIVTSPDKRAIWNDYSVGSLGEVSLRSVRATGRVQILAKENIRSGHVEVEGLEIPSADARSGEERPQAYGVRVLQGAFTLWNMQPDEDVVLSASLANISAGRFGAPVLGSGVFVSGARDKGGRVNVELLETGAVYADGKIAPGTPDEISGGVFTVYGAYVDLVRNSGPVVTYGANDMALDNWGVVDRWIAQGKVSTFGASGIGFVNFGSIRDLRVETPIETFGKGARGFNVYSGTVERAEFDRIVTHADGAVGVQISQPIGSLIVRRGIETFGGEGPSLVKGVVQMLAAIALSIKPGGYARTVRIEGGLKTHGKGIPPLEQQGAIDELVISGGFGERKDAAASRAET